jgi:hypothetical protein
MLVTRMKPIEDVAGREHWMSLHLLWNIYTFVRSPQLPKRWSRQTSINVSRLVPGCLEDMLCQWPVALRMQKLVGSLSNMKASFKSHVIWWQGNRARVDSHASSSCIHQLPLCHFCKLLQWWISCVLLHGGLQWLHCGSTVTPKLQMLYSLPEWTLLQQA